MVANSPVASRAIFCYDYCMQQILLVHGGDNWETHEEYLAYLKNKQIDFEKHGLRVKGWQDNLADRLGTDYQIIRPEMPSKRNAKHIEWKIWFEKFISYLNDGVILIGGSLGALFLAKYLSENDFPKKIKAVFLLAGPAKDNLPEYRLLDFSLPESLEKLSSQADKIFLYHSKDDNMVPFSDLEIYRKALPKATVRVLDGFGHFNLPELPVIIEDIKSL